MFRVADGSVRAFADYCPHRKLPFSLGSLVGGELVCGYHGLRFSTDSGRCTHIPTQDMIPDGFLDARIYPVFERYGLVHVWIGDPRLADPTLIPEFPEREDPDWVSVEDSCYVKANYRLLLDNLNDLSHVFFVHNNTLAAGVDPPAFDAPMDVVIGPDTVRWERIVRASGQTPSMRKSGQFSHDGLIDRLQSGKFLLPSAMILELGAGEQGGELKTNQIIFNAFTPETEKSTHYFWSVCRAASSTSEMMQFAHQITQAGFTEDKVAIEAQQKAIDEDVNGTALQAVAGDKAALAVRRVIARHVRGQAKAEVAA